jgi:hypothetical protein
MVSVWLSVDPIAEERQWLSPYNYCSLNPINKIYPDGMLEDWIYNKETKEYVWDGNVTKPSETPEGYEYIGPSLKDVNNHFEKNNPISSYFTNPEFGTNKTTWQGELSTVDNLTNVEMWLDSPSKNIGESAVKIAANIGYGMVNSPYSLFTGKTLAGTKLNSKEKTDAFIDTAPGFLSFGLTGTKTVIKVSEKGLKGFNNLVKALPALKSTKGLPSGMKWQTHAGQIFQWNKVNSQGLNKFNQGLKATSVGKEIEKERKK